MKIFKIHGAKNGSDPSSGNINENNPCYYIVLIVKYSHAGHSNYIYPNDF